MALNYWATFRRPARRAALLLRETVAKVARVVVKKLRALRVLLRQLRNLPLLERFFLRENHFRLREFLEWLHLL